MPEGRDPFLSNRKFRFRPYNLRPEGRRSSCGHNRARLKCPEGGANTYANIPARLEPVAECHQQAAAPNPPGRGRITIDKLLKARVHFAFAEVLYLQLVEDTATLNTS